MKRLATVVRETKETCIQAKLNLDGSGIIHAKTGMGFFDHMIESLAKHALFDLNLEAKGDLHVDYHHTVEDVGLVLGEVLKKALGRKEGIERFGFYAVPMDESLARVSLDLSGRPYLRYQVKSKKKKVGQFDVSLFHEFFNALAQTGMMTLHIALEYGEEPHHMFESIFKAVGRSLKMACQIGRTKAIPSTKGVLT